MQKKDYANIILFKLAIGTFYEKDDWMQQIISIFHYEQAQTNIFKLYIRKHYIWVSEMNWWITNDAYNMMETIHRPQFSLMYCHRKPFIGQEGTKNMKTLQFGLFDNSQRLAKNLSLDFRSIIILIHRLLARSVSACSYYQSMKKSTRKKI